MKSKKNSIFKFNPEDLELSLNKKIKKINEIFSEGLKLSKNPLLLFSGGSDSLLLLAFLLKHKPDINVLYVDMNMNFPEFNKLFEKKIKPKIKNLHYFKINYSEEDFVKKFGIPIYPGIEEIGYEKKDFSKLNLNCACSELKDSILKEQYLKLKPDLTIMGFLASDKPKRYKRVLERGYLQLGNPENLFLPIAMLKKEEVFKILDKLNFPYVKDIYFHQDTGNLCKGDGVCYMCSAKCFNNPEIGNWNLIKKNYPKLWGKMLKYGLKEKIEELYIKTKNKAFKDALEFYF
jgi:3'-phosphoadenosine 5'-phosphosulfate sulfotransferase (PAPS reductase)/FAD synthetase